MKYSFTKFGALLSLGIVLNSCGFGIGIGVSWHPKFIPEGWIDSYDYEEELTTYLRSQFNAAVTEQKVPYVYIYSDERQQDRNLRRRVINFTEYSELFAHTQIILLQYHRLRDVKNAPNYGGVPIIAPIEVDGVLGNPVLDGTSWDRMLPREIDQILCNYFSLRFVEEMGPTRDCGALVTN